MKNLNFLLAVILIIFLLSCEKEDKTVIEPEMEIKSETILPLPEECIFGQNNDQMGGLLDSLEQVILKECSECQLITKDEISENIIGEWQLIGYANGWIGILEQPCAYIKITTNELIYTFQDNSKDTTTTHSWDIEEFYLTNENKRFFLRTIPEYIEGLQIIVFCKNYMFQNQNESDGDMYLYQKVK